MLENQLTSAEREQFQIMEENWNRLVPRNQALTKRYNGDMKVKDLGISIPPAMSKQLSKCSLMWSKQAVDRLMDASILDGFAFVGGRPEGFDDVMRRNEICDQYDEIKPLFAAHGCSFWTVSAGAAGEPAALISAYDAEHATALINERTREPLCGFAVVETDKRNNIEPVAANFYNEFGDIVEAEKINGRWVYRRLHSGLGRCAMEVMRNNPDNGDHVFGRSVITTAIKSLEDEANREVVRSSLQSELYTAPTRWIMGVDGDIFNGGHWNAYLGSIFALEAEDPENPPTTGQYPQANMTPHTDYMRYLAQLFAAEASIPVQELISTEANPASAEALEASRHALVERVERINRLNGRSLRNIGLMTLSVMEEVPVAELGEIEHSLSVQWRNPLFNSLAASADAASKIAATVPGFAGTATYWKMLGYNEEQIAVLLAEVAASDYNNAQNAALANSNATIKF